MRRFIFLFALISLIGTTTLVEANTNQKLRAPKYPKRVDQRPEAPKLVARDDYYSPRFLQIKVIPGNEISMVNKGANIHGLVIPALSQINVIRPGESKKIPIEEDVAPGMYDFFCHLHPRMRGTIQVLPKT